jgi:hypothetical protein
MSLQKIAYHTGRPPLPAQLLTANGEPHVNRVPAS